MTARAFAERPYVSIASWPKELDRELVAQLIADAAGIDFETVRLRLGVAPPSILGPVEPRQAAAALAALAAHGCSAFAPTLADIEALGPTLKIKDLRLERGAIEVDLWRGATTTIRRDAVQILVRAHLEETSRHIDAAPPAGTLGAPDGPGGGGRRWRPSGSALSMGGAMGLAVSYGAAYAYSDGPMVIHQTTRSDKLDIHTTDGRVFQIDGDKFGYQVLGDLRGHGDKANMDSMLELLSHLAPDEIVDPYFSLWTKPPGYDRLKIPMMAINKDDPAFAFYSRWVALLYRWIMGGRD